MNKSELRNCVQRSMDCSAVVADRSIKAVFDALVEGLHRDSSVQILGFGSFQVKERGARTIRNPSTGQNMSVPPSKTVQFRAGKNLRASFE